MNEVKKLKRMVIGLSITLLLLTGYIIADKVITHYQKEEQVAQVLQSTALSILGYLEYDQGNFKIVESLKQEFHQYLGSLNLTYGGNNYLASVYDLNNDKIVWSSITFQNYTNTSEKELQLLNNNLVATSEFQEIRKTKGTAAKQSILKTKTSDGIVDYRIGIQFFTYPNKLKNDEYVFVVFRSL